MTDELEGGWDKVGPWLDRVIAESGKSQAQILRESGMAHQTLSKLRRGEAVAYRHRLSALAQVLGYQSDAFDLVRRGQAPGQTLGLPVIEGSTPDARLNAVEERLERIEAAVQQLLDRGAP